MKRPDSQRTYRLEADGVRVVEVIAMLITDNRQVGKYAGNCCKRLCSASEYLASRREEVRPSNDFIATIRNRPRDDVTIAIPGNHRAIFVLEQRRHENALFATIAG